MQQIRSEAIRLALPTTEFTAGRIPITSGGRGAHGLTPSDAHRLYRTLHHGPVVVCATANVFVRRDPSREVSSEGDLWPLASFVGHKGCHLLVSEESSVGSLDSEFRAWQDRLGQVGLGDARALPMHIFDPDEAWLGLPGAEAKSTFRTRFGVPSRRVDDQRRDWTPASAAHGREAEYVVGTVFPSGTHWDVAFGRAGSLVRADGVWVVPKGGYLNVYPGAGVRGGRSGTPTAKRVWEPPKRENASR